MSTHAQIAANQANAQHSTGPRTPEGRASSSRNNFRVGLTGDNFNVLDWERQEEFDQLLNDLRAEHKPATRTENLLVEKMAQCYWLSQRATFLQKMCLDSELPLVRPTEEKVFALYMRYQTTHDRAFHKSLNELLKLRAEKRKAEIGFESQKQKAEQEARKQANENRKQELHKSRVWLAEAKAEHQELLNMNLETPETRVPGRVERILARQKAA